MAPRNSANLRLSRFIKLLEVSKSPEVIRSLILAAPDNVIKEICNIALNCYKCDFTLSPKQKKILKKFRRPIIKLTNRDIPLTHKRKIIVQEGGAIWIPLLAGALLTTFGGKILDMIQGK